MTPTKKKRLSPKPKVIEVEPPIPVQVIPDSPKESRIVTAQRGITRGILFVVGLTPTIAFAFDIIVLRPEYVDPSIAFVILMLVGLVVSFAVANIADNKLGKSAKELAPIVKGIMRTSKSGNTTEHHIEPHDK